MCIRDSLEESLKTIEEDRYKRVLLEVIESNDKAISLYDSFDFRPRRLFRCFKRNEITTGVIRADLEIVKADNWEALSTLAFHDYEPSFIDDLEQLRHNSDYEQILLVKEGEKVLGYAIFQPLLGRISQLAVTRNHRRQKIGTTLIHTIQNMSKKDNLSILNSPDDQKEMIAFLESRGFKNEINQIEMIRNF